MEVKAEVTKMYPHCKVSTYVVDVSRREEVYASAKQVQQQDGFVYGLINNAGVVSGKLFVEIEDEAIERTINVNLMAHFWTVKAFLPAMIKRNEGHLVSISSAAGLMGNVGMSDYCASKFAAVGFLEAMRLEMEKMKCRGIATSIVCPAHVQTQLFQGFKSIPLVPSLRPNYVGAKVVEAIQRQKRVLIMPRVGYFAIALKALLPTAVFDWSNSLLGVDNSMDAIRAQKLGG
mmetsp:Transcript_38257/g.75334  ORF Transcript_38257/g.75334 Transcript_38257/m.75334 type:complete len:232 (+) Transcript_38257:149-844(+)